jgi:hypothetical protein
MKAQDTTKDQIRNNNKNLIVPLDWQANYLHQMKQHKK